MQFSKKLLIRGTIDEDRKRNGRFLLLGSVSPALMQNVSESLAGRMGLIAMAPFILPELKARQMDELSQKLKTTFAHSARKIGPNCCAI